MQSVPKTIELQITIPASMTTVLCHLLYLRYVQLHFLNQILQHLDYEHSGYLKVSRQFSLKLQLFNIPTPYVWDLDIQMSTTFIRKKSSLHLIP